MTQNHDLCSLRDLYVLGGLSPSELREFETHLKSCEECATELPKLRAAHDWLLYAAPDVAPPEGMKARVLGNVFADEGSDITDEADSPESVQTVEVPSQRTVVRKAPMRLTRLLAGAAAVFLIGAIGTWMVLSNRPSSNPLSGHVIASGTLHTIGQGQASMAIVGTGTSQRMLLNFKGLPAVGNAIYEVWLIPGHGTPVPAGGFRPDQSGQAVFATVVSSKAFDTVAVTVEKQFENAPQGKMVFEGKFA